MRLACMVLAALALGAAGGLLTARAIDESPAAGIRNGVLDGWSVTRDDETLLCADPTVFVRARQIQCP